MARFEYLLVLILSGFIPFLFTFHPNSKLKNNLFQVFAAILITALPWILWDIWATDRGHWSFNQDYILGVKIINLPVEEILFFLVIPFCSLFVWTLVRDFKNLSHFIKQMLNQK